LKTAADTRHILDSLEGQHPDADTELHYQNAFQLLVATILSAQSTDQGVNMVTPALFKRYPDAKALAAAALAELEPQIHSTGFFRQKSKALVGMAQALVEHHHGEVPADMDALVQLPGVGRKTANVVLGHALGVPGLPVDRHVLRVSNRIGIAESDDPIVVEQQLCAALPPARWIRASDTLILHGRRICRPQPRCDVCAVVDVCDYYNAPGTRVAPALRHAEGRKGRPKGRRVPRDAAQKPASKKTSSKPKKNSPAKKVKPARGTPRVRRPRR
jgi:endonuclease-3